MTPEDTDKVERMAELLWAAKEQYMADRYGHGTEPWKAIGEYLRGKYRAMAAAALSLCPAGGET